MSYGKSNALKHKLIDVIELTKIAGGFNKTHQLTDIEEKELEHILLQLKASKVNTKTDKITSKFTRQHLKSSVKMTIGISILELTNGKYVLVTSTKPDITIKFSNVNVHTVKGTPFLIPDNVAKIHYIESNYEFTQNPEVTTMQTFFVDKDSWINNFRGSITTEFHSLYQDITLTCELKGNRINTTIR